MSLPTSGNVAHARGRGFGAQLDDLLLRLAVAPDRLLDIQTAPLQPRRVDTSSAPEEFRPDFGDTFARSDFSYGEGLNLAHRRLRADDDSGRFWDSRGVDVVQAEAGDHHHVRLLRATEVIDAAVGVDNLHLHYDGSRLWMANGTNLRVSALTSNPPTFATEDPQAGESAQQVRGIASLGTGDVYAALGANGIHRRLGADPWAHYSALQATGIWGVKGRLMATAGPSIYEVVASGAAPSALKTLGEGITWTDVTDGGSHILASATDGYVYAFAPDNTGALVLAAQSKIENEIPSALAQTRGIVFYGTYSAGGLIGRLWRAALHESGLLSGHQLVREWRTAGGDDMAPKRIIVTGDSVYTAIPEAGALYAWRYSLPTGGLFRSYEFGHAGGNRTAPGLAFANDRLFATLTGAGLYWRGDDYVADGYLIGPLGDFFTSAPKSWVSSFVDTAPVLAGQKVELFYTTDEAAIEQPTSASWVFSQQVTLGQDKTEAPLVGVSGRHIAGQVRLYSAAGASTPDVHAFGFRAYPGRSGSEVIVRLPVNLSDQIEAPGRARLRVPGRGALVHQELKKKEGSAALLKLFRTGDVVRGLVLEVSSPIPVVGKRGSVTLYAMVTVRGRRVPESAALTGDGLGTGLLGVTSMGGAA